VQAGQAVVWVVGQLESCRRAAQDQEMVLLSCAALLLVLKP